MQKIEQSFQEIGTIVLVLAKMAKKEKWVKDKVRKDISVTQRKIEEKLSETNAKITAAQASIEHEQGEPSDKKMVAGIEIKFPAKNKIDSYEKIKKEEMIVVEEKTVEKKRLMSRRERKEITKLLKLALGEGSKLIKEHQKKIAQIKKYLDEKGLPYLAIVPDQLWEKMVKDFNLFHFRSIDFSGEYLIIPKEKNPSSIEKNTEYNIYWDEILRIDKELVSGLYQGKISRCFFNGICQSCEKKLCKKNYSFQERAIVYQINSYERYFEVYWKVKVFLPDPTPEAGKNIKEWALKCDPKHLFTIAAEEAVDVEPITVDLDPISGYDLRGIDKKYIGYSAIICQYGPFINEERAKRFMISYFQEIIGQGIDLAERIN